jgi:hypothetical protein
LRRQMRELGRGVRVVIDSFNGNFHAAKILL